MSVNIFRSRKVSHYSVSAFQLNGFFRECGSGEEIGCMVGEIAVCTACRTWCLLWGKGVRLREDVSFSRNSTETENEPLASGVIVVLSAIKNAVSPPSSTSLR